MLLSLSKPLELKRLRIHLVHLIVLFLHLFLPLLYTLVHLYPNLVSNPLKQPQICLLLFGFHLLDLLDKVIPALIFALEIHQGLMQSRCLHLLDLLTRGQIINTDRRQPSDTLADILDLPQPFNLNF